MTNRHFDLAGMLAVVTVAAMFPASTGASCVTRHTVMIDRGQTAA